MVDVPNEMPVMGRFVCLGGLDNIPLVVHHEISQLHLLSDTEKQSAIDPKRPLRGILQSNVSRAASFANSSTTWRTFGRKWRVCGQSA